MPDTGIAGNEAASMKATTMHRASERELVIERTFNGPQRIVFDAWTQADLVRRWWAPRSLGVTMVSCEADVRVGGRYRYVLQPRGLERFAFSGTYREVTPYSRLVYTTLFEPGAMPSTEGSGAAVATVTFDDRAGQTHVVARELYPSKEVLDAVLASGMERGMRETMDQLDELVASLG